MSDQSAHDIIDLQSQLAFQQASIDELHITVARQENDIATLTEALRRLGVQVSELSPSGMDNPAVETPPHY